MNSSAPTVWPNDADGDVLRRLAANGFDFQAKHSIDFNVDFDTWPPSQEFVTQLGAHYDKVEVIDPDDDGDGYVLFVIKSKLSYELVMFVQDAVSALAAPYGGKCETLGGSAAMRSNPAFERTACTTRRVFALPCRSRRSTQR